MVVYNLAQYYNGFEGILKLWIQFGTGTKIRNIPLHNIAQKLGPYECKVLLQVHVLMGCFFTRKKLNLGHIYINLELDIQHMLVSNWLKNTYATRCTI